MSTRTHGLNQKRTILTFLPALLLLACAAYQPIFQTTAPPAASEGQSAPSERTQTPFQPGSVPRDPPQAAEMLTLTSAQIGQVTLEVKAFSLAGQAMQVSFEARGPGGTLDDPESPLQPVIRQVQALAGDTPLAMEPAGSAGGTVDDGMGGRVVEEVYSFSLAGPVPAGQVITLIVTLNEGFGLEEPVRFTLEADSR